MIATIGFGGWELPGDGLTVANALGRAMVDLLTGKKFEAASAAPPVSQQQVTQQVDPDDAKQQAMAVAALKPIVLDGMIPEFVAANRESLLREASAEKSARVTPFLRDNMYVLTEFYRKAGVDEYDWHVFGPDLKDATRDFHSFDPPEEQPKDDGSPRYREVTCPDGMENWFEPEFDVAASGWQQGLPPFGQLGGEPAPLNDTCTSPFCGCSITPRSLWEKEVLLMRGTFEIPRFKEGHRYRFVVGGSAHVNAGEGYAIYVNGKQLIEYPSGAGKRQGGQPRGTFIDAEFVSEFQGEQITIAATSFPGGFPPARQRNSSARPLQSLA